MLRGAIEFAEKNSTDQAPRRPGARRGQLAAVSHHMPARALQRVIVRNKSTAVVLVHVAQ
jgi:hypothetical protein